MQKLWLTEKTVYELYRKCTHWLGSLCIKHYIKALWHGDVQPVALLRCFQGAHSNSGAVPLHSSSKLWEVISK